MRYQVAEESYVAFSGDDEEIFDTQEEELNINWCVLVARVFSIVLLVCMIASYCLGKLDKRFYILGAILFGACGIVLVGSFFECFQRRCFMSTYRHSSHPDRLPAGFPRTTSKIDASVQNSQYIRSMTGSSHGFA
jgi:hypothetical protein